MKIYKSSSSLSLNVVINDARVHIQFYDICGGGSKFQTDDESICEALESSPYYGDLFSLESEVIPENIVSADKTDLISVEEITKAADGKMFLLDKGYEGKGLVAKADIKAAAAAMGYSFPNL